jgi:hypothetical protein
LALAVQVQPLQVRAHRGQIQLLQPLRLPQRAVVAVDHLTAVRVRLAVRVAVRVRLPLL